MAGMKTFKALASYAVGPYIMTNITDKNKSLDDVKNEFLKFLKIEVNLHSHALVHHPEKANWKAFSVSVYRLRYHKTNHLVKKNSIFEGVADETLSPSSLECLIVMEWLHRMYPRLIQLMQEKLLTQLSAPLHIGPK